jgi:glycogen synthase
MFCLEAMMAARPVIASSSGGMKEIIRDRESGMLLPPPRPDLLAKRILEKSSNMMPMVGNAARHQVMESFSSLVLADQYTSFYQMVSCNTLS